MNKIHESLADIPIAVGQKVICIDADFSNIRTDKTIPREYMKIKLPEQDGKYTIREVVKTEPNYSILLEEIRNPEIHHDRGGWKEPAFSSARFKPA